MKRLAKQGANHVAVADDHDRPAGGGVVFLRGVDAEGVVEAGGHVVGRDAFVGAGRVALSSLSPITWPPRTPPPAISMNMQRADSGRGRLRRCGC